LLTLAIMLMSSPADKKSLRDLWKLGFGQVHPDVLIGPWALDSIQSYGLAITANILIANLPQAVLSFLYVLVNGLLTSLFLAQEWSGYAQERKALRVSSRRGQQRRTYFLSLPYRISIPLLIMCGLLHWLCSQSIFLAVVSQYSEEGKLIDPFAIATCGFSPLAMMATLLVGVCILAGILALGFRRLDCSMPLAGTCSAAISAACHESKPDASLKPLQWGALPGADVQSDIGHCCFSSCAVVEPTAGKKYA
jgi:hypothetical protein